MVEGIYTNIFRWFYIIIILSSVFLSKDTFAQNSDIHSAQIIKEKQQVNSIADSLSWFDYSITYDYCIENLHKKTFNVKPDLYSDLLYRASVAAFQMAKVKLSDSLNIQLMHIQIKNMHPILQARILQNKANISYFTSRNIDAVRYAKECLVIYQQNKNNHSQVILNQLLGKIYFSMKRFDNSIHYYSEAVEIAKKSKNNKDYFFSLLNRVSVYKSLDRFNEIKKSLNIADELMRELKDDAMKVKLTFVYAQYYFTQKSFLKANMYFNSALQYYLTNNMKMQASKTYTWMAAVAVRIGEYDKAVQLNQLAASLRKNANSVFLQASSQYNIANSLIYLKEYDSALYYIDKGEELYMPFKNKPDYIRGMDLRKKIFIERNEYDKAYAILETKMKVQDSMFSARNKVKLKELESDFAMDKFDQVKSEMLAEEFVQKIENKRNTLILYIVSVILFLVVISSVLFVIHIRSKNKRDVILATQKLIFIQMNSHFVFNALTAIQSLIYKKQLESAILNLTIFSNLINKIMEGTQKKYISLQLDIDFIKDFLDMQHLRFGELI
ncbi:MAG: hypothetical protein DRJ01_17900, partial [Bacteroidetes bacterium]